MNELIGHNQPDLTETAKEVVKDLSDWMAETPVVQNEEQARSAKLLVDRASLCIQDMEAERKSKTSPLQGQIEEINGHYRAPRELLRGVVDELKRRFDSFLLLEERKRVLAAQEAARIAAIAEQAAKVAEAKERETIEDAAGGVVGLDIAARTAEADQAFADYQKAEHKAALADRETHVKIGGGFRRSASLRNAEILDVISYTDACLALQHLGVTEDIKEAILKSARAYKRLNGKYPEGITVSIERKT